MSSTSPAFNVTGMAVTFDPTLVAKELQLLKEASPRISRVGIMTRSSSPRNASLDAARSLALTVFYAPLDAAAELNTALATVTRERADALLVVADGPNILRRHEIFEFALRNRLPSVGQKREMAEAGSLLAHMPDFFEMFRRAPRYVDQIFKGAKPGDLPVQQSDRWSLIINLRTAKALGLTIPPSLLLRADQVIQ